MKKVGIMGGTFNPIHLGHLMLAENAYDFCKLDEVWFIPSADPPHKIGQPVLDYIHRSRMTELAIEGIPYFVKYDFEAQRSERSYTAETLRRFLKSCNHTKRRCFAASRRPKQCHKFTWFNIQ